MNNVDGFDGGTLNQCVDSYTVTYAREFRYDGSRQRYLNRELDPVALQIDGQYNELTAVWSDYVGDNVYSDYSANRLAQSPDPTFADIAMYQPGMGQVTGLDTAFPDASYYVTNHLGTTMNRFGKDNAIDATPATYSAFGERIDTGTYERYGYAGSWGYQQHNSFEFTDAGGGAIQTPEPPGPSGTHHMAFQFSHVGARYYDPAVGRFMQRDPIGILGGLNVYAYVGNRPTAGVDPTGYAAKDDLADLAGILAGLGVCRTSSVCFSGGSVSLPACPLDL